MEFQSRAREFQAGVMHEVFGLPPGPDPLDHEAYSAWHDEHIAGPVRESQRAGQIAVARGHLQAARTYRELGDKQRARTSLRRAGTERSIAARMPRGA